MGRVKEVLFDAEYEAELAAREASPEGRAETERLDREVAIAVAGRRRREKVWAVRHPDEWTEWLRLQPLLSPVIDFWNPGEFTFDDFLREVGRCPSANHVVVRRDESLPYEQGNMVWNAKLAEPPSSPYLNVDEAAAYLGVAKQTIYNNRCSIPSLPGFRTLMFDPKVLDQLRADPRFMSKRRSSPR